MKMMIENALTTILIVVGALIFAGIIAVNLQISSAKQFHKEAVDRIETSNFSPVIIGSCVEEARTADYTLLVADKSVYDYKKSMKVTMYYDVKLPLLGIIKEGVLEDYAR